MAIKPILSTNADLEASLLAGAAVLVMPTGVVLPFAGNSSPAGWLACDGAAVSRTTYASLFAAISTSFGVGDGITTFNLPDLRGRFPRFNDAMFGGAAASRDTGRVHGSAQAQATAKNGLANAASSINGSGAASSITGGVTDTQGNHNHSFIGRANATGFGVFGVARASNSGTTSELSGDMAGAGSHSHSVTGTAAGQVVTGTAAAQVITGDNETRPINLSINAIIKI